MVCVTIVYVYIYYIKSPYSIQDEIKKYRKKERRGAEKGIDAPTDAEEPAV